MNDLFPMMEQVAFEKVERDRTVSRRWKSSELDMTANVVCKPCNETWMSKIEDQHAKPSMSDLILGKPIREITAGQASSISLFAFKTSVVCNHMHPEDEEFFSISDRYAFKKSLVIPERAGMWFYGVEPGLVAGGVRSMNVYFPDKQAPHLTLNVCSFYIGQFGFQVVSIKNNPTSRATALESLPVPPNLSFLFHPSISSGISWPRNVVLRGDKFDDFHNIWNAVRFR
jgi:hypothetical protein